MIYKFPFYLMCFLGATFYEWLKDIIIPITIAVGTGYLAYFIFVKERISEKKKDKKVQEDYAKNLTRYFDQLILESTRKFANQIQDLVDFTNTFKQNTYAFPAIKIDVSQAAKRLANSTEHKDYLSAFIYKKNKTEGLIIENFQNIISSIDYIAFSQDHIPQQISHFRTSLFDKYTKIDDIYNLLLFEFENYLLQNSAKEELKQFLAEIGNVMQEHSESNKTFKSRHSGMLIKHKYETFIEPLRKRIGSFPNSSPEFAEKTANLYHQLDIVRSEFKATDSSISDFISHLEGEAGRMRETFNKITKARAKLETL